MIVAPGGSKDGGTMTSHTDDCMECDFRISKVPAADHEAGSVRDIYGYRAAYPRWLGYGRGETYEPENTDFDIYPWKVGEGAFAPDGSIPQVEHTYAYIDGGYGIMNEHQLSIGESTCGARITALSIPEGGQALVEAAELTRIAMERCATAVCAVQTMGDLAVKYGYHGADATFGEGGESLQVIDPNDAWVFHIVADDTGTSAVWVAQRVPHGHMAVVANQFIIREVDLEDKENFMGSSNILEVAERAGLWDSKTQGKKVDFTAAFALDRRHLSPYANLRRWRAFTLAAPSLDISSECSTFADEYPFSVEVENGGLTVAQAVAINRDHYEGTNYDMTKGLAGGPYGDPSRFDPNGNRGIYEAEYDDDATDAADATDDVFAFKGQFQRAISIYRCAYNWVSSSRPDVHNALGTVWFGQYAGHDSAAVPLYAGIKKVPKAFSTGSLSKFTFDASYWVHAVLGNWADRFYIHTIGDIKKVQHSLESAQFNAQEQLIATVNSMKKIKTEDEITDFLTETSQTASEIEMTTFKDLLFTLFAKFKDGQRIDDFHASVLAPTKFFYPKWWLEAVGFEDTSMEDADSNTPVEGAPSPDIEIANQSMHASFISHLLVALLSVVGTVAFINHFNSSSSNSSKDMLFGTSDQHMEKGEDMSQPPNINMFGPAGSSSSLSDTRHKKMNVELGQMNKAGYSTRQSYQQVI
jgi:dipeptidase